MIGKQFLCKHYILLLYLYQVFILQLGRFHAFYLHFYNNVKLFLQSPDMKRPNDFSTDDDILQISPIDKTIVYAHCPVARYSPNIEVEALDT